MPRGMITFVMAAAWVAVCAGGIALTLINTSAQILLAFV